MRSRGPGPLLRHRFIFIMKHPHILLAASLCFTCGTSLAQNHGKDFIPPKEYIDAGAKSPILSASQRGDADALKITAGSSVPGIGPVGKALLARLLGNFSASSTIANQCLDDAIADGTRPEVGLVCAQIISTDILMMGDFKGAALRDTSDWKRLYPQLSRATGKTQLTTRSLETSTSVLRGTDAKPTSFGRNERIRKLPFESDNKRFSAPGERLFVSSTVNGNIVRLQFDTGAQLSALSAPDAARLGLKVRDVSAGSFTRDGRRTAVAGVATVDDWVIGGLSVRHAEVLVLNYDQSILGIDLIRRLSPTVRIGHQGLRFGEKPGSCDSPMNYLLSFDGAGTFGFAMDANIGGESRKVLLDTGDNQYLSLRSDETKWRTSDAIKTTMVTTINHSGEQPYHDGQASIEADHRRISAPVVIFPADRSVIPWTLGSGVLKDFDIEIDNAGNHVCLIAPATAKTP